MKRDYRVICDRSGFYAWRSQCRKTWDGKLVLKRFWWPRNPLDFAPREVDAQPLQDPRPEGTDNFLSVNEVQPSDLY